ncbi:MAG: hypothetical protein JXQ80_07625 [Bacteroidales bacterium]|nr:hypothetical protein [Bacteroidales bacterium]
MKALVKTIILLLFLINQRGNGQITYDYYKNPDKIGSSNPSATQYFIRSFEFIMQWGDEDTDSAIYYMQKAIEEDSLYAIAYASLGHLIKYGGYNGTSIDADSISRLAEKALRINPRCGDAQTLMSWVYYMNNDYQKAIEVCKKAVEAEPDHRETWLWLGVRYAHLPEKIDSAIAAFNKCIEVDPTFGQPHQKLGWIYLYDMLDYQKAAYHFRKMVSLYENIEPRDERMIVGYYGLGESLISMKEWDDAIDTLDLLQKKCDHSSLLWVDNLRSWGYSGLVRAYMGKAETELDSFIAHNMGTLDKHPNDMGITLNVIEEFEGLFYQLKAFNFSDTLKQIRMPLYERVFSNSKDDYEITRAIESKNRSLQENKKYSEANAMLKSLMIRNSGNSEFKSTIYFLMASNYACLEMPNKALKYLDLSIKAGFNDFSRIRSEPSFERLRDNPRFEKVAQSQ